MSYKISDIPVRALQFHKASVGKNPRELTFDKVETYADNTWSIIGMGWTYIPRYSMFIAISHKQYQAVIFPFSKYFPAEPMVICRIIRAYSKNRPLPISILDEDILQKNIELWLMYQELPDDAKILADTFLEL